MGFLSPALRLLFSENAGKWMQNRHNDTWCVLKRRRQNTVGLG